MLFASSTVMFISLFVGVFLLIITIMVLQYKSKLYWLLPIGSFLIALLVGILPSYERIPIKVTLIAKTNKFVAFSDSTGEIYPSFYLKDAMRDSTNTCIFEVKQYYFGRLTQTLKDTQIGDCK